MAEFQPFFHLQPAPVAVPIASYIGQHLRPLAVDAAYFSR